MIALALSVTTIVGTAAAKEKEIQFSDVDTSTLEGTAIYKLVEHGIIDGMGDGTFLPKGTLTRAQFCKMVNLIWNYTKPAAVGFTDVLAEHWYYDHALIGKEAGYINGFEDGSFRGELPVTREQACAIVSRIAKLKDVHYTNTILDAISPWAENAVRQMIGNELIFVEEGDTFRATENMKRGEVAMLLANFVKDTPEEEPKEDPKEDPKDDGKGNGNGNSNGNGGGIVVEKPKPVDYTAENAEVVKNLKIARDELSTKKSTFTEPQQKIITIMIDIMDSVIEEQSTFKISTSSVSTRYSAEILEAYLIYNNFDESGQSLFVFKISQLNKEVFDFLKTFFGVDPSDFVKTN